MKAHALDLRERIVKFIQSGGSKAEAARRFDLARSSVYRYLAAAKKERYRRKPAGELGANSIPRNSAPMSKDTPMPPLKKSKKCLELAITPSGCGWANWASH